MSRVYNTTDAPWKSVVFVYSKWPGGVAATGSGVIVGDNDVLTAAHCVYRGELGYATEVRVAPGYDTGRAPLGFFKASSVQSNRVDDDGDGRMGYEEMRRDVAILGFEQKVSSVGDTMKMDHTFYQGLTHVTGFPDVYHGEMIDNVAKASYNFATSFININEHAVYPGNSGGPLWRGSDDDPHVVGVVSTRMAAADIGTNFRSIKNWMEGNNYSTYKDAGQPDRVIFVNKSDARVIRGTDGSDIIAGTSGSDAIYGSDGDDVFHASHGFDLVVGGQGFDSIAIAVPLSDVQVTNFGLGIRIDTPEGKIVAFDIERLVFVDTSLEITSDPTVMASMNIGFDADFYLQQNPDVSASGIDPWAHFQAQGWMEGRDPNPLFDVAWYVEQNPQLVEAGLDPVTHYLETGIYQGASPSPAISTAALFSMGNELA
ncbi:trypsin-like serine protease [Haematospirillum jordaniae]|nr:trypsin-like serine protease [Haematospirillum jordaniae]NKD45658.1 trypsin-like serine protease [Haematospirillum jordaniae]NKD57785.1 trypsin-like serine protease [Haematospirillum jordaniae]NKD59729.1 trypsin-like serine protease [Haematospirillum jordaniae]NKD67613.1 trypsin-like serine protease [Haematospirillum jordaniae]NKD79640.1 trypsin-like serine protease [Haematospirillum jordaniae]